ncbi:MAG: hypothetical protein RPU64_09075 [Candidatus Sedimenticola sp. (ex Thyasira tokunagai)]
MTVILISPAGYIEESERIDMAKIKVGKKELKQFKKKVLKADAKVKKLQQEIAQLDKRLVKRDERIKDLQRRSKGKASEKKEEISLENIQKSVSIKPSRDALQKAGFLRNRYEQYLELNKAKTVARREANRDLVESYGPEAGFTDQELEDVLS